MPGRPLLPPQCPLPVTSLVRNWISYSGGHLDGFYCNRLLLH